MFKIIFLIAVLCVSCETKVVLQEETEHFVYEEKPIKIIKE